MPENQIFRLHPMNYQPFSYLCKSEISGGVSHFVKVLFTLNFRCIVHENFFLKNTAILASRPVGNSC